MEKDDYVRHHEQLKAEMSQAEVNKDDYLMPQHDKLDVEFSPTQMLEDAYARRQEELKARISQIETKEDDYLQRDRELNVAIGRTRIENEDYLLHRDRLAAEISHNKMVADDYLWPRDEPKAEIGQTEMQNVDSLRQEEVSRIAVEKDDDLRQHDERIYDARNLLHVPSSALIEQYLAKIRQSYDDVSQCAADVTRSPQQFDYSRGASIVNIPRDVVGENISEVPSVTVTKQLTPPPQDRLVFVFCIQWR